MALHNVALLGLQATSSFRAKRESPKVALHNVALLGKLPCQDILLRPKCPYWGSAHQVFNLHIRSCAFSLCTPFSFMYFHIKFLQCLWSSYLSVSTHFHLPITTSSSVFLSTCPNHCSLASLIFSIMFATPALALISSFLIFSILYKALYIHYPVFLCYC